MLRLFSLLFAFGLIVTNSAAVAVAMCQHQSAQAHTAARQSPDNQESSSALTEEMAERSASSDGTSADPLPTLGTALMPDGTAVPKQVELVSRPETAGDQTAPPNRSIAPQLRPPLR